MLERNKYFENLKDFFDEQLCSVAAKISEKKGLQKTKQELFFKHREIMKEI
jgi:hypothetical protein